MKLFSLYKRKVIDNSNWTAYVKMASSDLLESGFRIVESKDEGMGKLTVLSRKPIRIRFIYDRGPIHCDILTTFGELDLIHLCNYLNGRGQKYQHPKYNFEEGHETRSKYLSLYLNIIKKEEELLFDCIKRLNKKKFKDIQAFSWNRNLEGHSSKMNT